MTAVQMTVVIACIIVLVVAFVLMAIEANKVPALERSVRYLEAQLRAERDASHQLALRIGAAKRRFPEWDCGVWAQVQAEEALAKERERSASRRGLEAKP